MPTTHRGDPTGGNHNPTPRLAQAVAEMANQVILSGEGANRTLAGFMPRMTPVRAQHFIDAYRRGRDFGTQTNPEKAEVIARAIMFQRQGRG